MFTKSYQYHCRRRLRCICLKQEGRLSPTERASVSAHFSLPWVRPWDNHGKCYMYGKMIQSWPNALQNIAYPSIFNCLRAIARYWSEIATFSYSIAFNAPVGVFPLKFQEKFGRQKTRIMGLPGSEDSLTIGWAVSTQYQRVTDRQTDRRPAYSYNVRSMTDAR